MPIKVKYSTVDRFTETRSFQTLTGARTFARKWVGQHPEIGSRYAVSGDGIGKIEVSGGIGPVGTQLRELFGD